MKFTLEPMDENVRITSRQTSSPVHDALATIQADEKYHGQLMKLASFTLPEEKGRAHQQKQSLTNTYGNSPAILGFNFVVTRSIDNSTEYLGVVFDPSRMEEGAYDTWAEAKDAKAAKAKERKAQKTQADLKREAKADIKKLSADEADEWESKG